MCRLQLVSGWRKGGDGGGEPGEGENKALLGAARSLESGPWLSPPPLFLSPLSPASTSPYTPCRSWPGLPGPEPPPRAPGTPNTPDTLIRQLSPFA